MKKSLDTVVKVLVPIGALGMGVDQSDVDAGIAQGAHVIACDAGSTDSGPAYLATGLAKYSRDAVKSDLTILMRAFSIARRSTDAFGRLVCVGVMSWFAFQTFENIGMTLGLMPMTGVPLPFLSYGGSSMFANLIGFGLLQNIYARQRG
ncbi:MAG: hypothetical protein RI904_2918 [Pseudomonadota bacterium]